MSLINTLNRLQSFDALTDVLKGTSLHPLQCVDVLRALCSKKSIVRYDTGMGKTYIACAWMKCLKNEIPKRRFIFVCKNSQLLQTPSKIRALTGFKVMTTDASLTGISSILSSDIEKCDVLMITLEGLNNYHLMSYLSLVKDKFCGVIVDEAHNYSNFTEASSSFMLYSFLHNFEYVMALTATPTTTSLEQSVKLFHMIDRNQVKDMYKFMKVLEHNPKNIEVLDGYLLNRTRRDFGVENCYIPGVVNIRPLPHQVDVTGKDMFKTTKGVGAYNSVEALATYLMERALFKGLVYINTHEIREFVVPYLDAVGIKYHCVHGKNKEMRSQYIKDFNNGVVDVIITNLTESLDLDCDYVAFYEFTSNCAQMIGRSERGLIPKTINIDFFFVECTGEYDFFMENVYSTSLIVSALFNEQYGEFIRNIKNKA